MADETDNLAKLTRDRLCARVRELELDNFRQHQRIERLDEELRAAAARERHLARAIRNALSRVRGPVIAA